MYIFLFFFLACTALTAMQPEEGANTIVAKIVLLKAQIDNVLKKAPENAISFLRDECSDLNGFHTFISDLIRKKNLSNNDVRMLGEIVLQLESSVKKSIRLVKNCL